MTRPKKGSKPSKKVQPAIDLATRYRSLPKEQQESIVHFFNLHNAATFIFNAMSPDAQDYSRICIELSAEANDIENQNV